MRIALIVENQIGSSKLGNPNVLYFYFYWICDGHENSLSHKGDEYWVMDKILIELNLIMKIVHW